MLMVVSGPSGAGKTSVVDGLADRVPFHFSVSMTTRQPRESETDGVDYWFVSRDEFEARIEAGDLLEWAEYNGQLYGTPKAPVVQGLAAGHDVVLDIENHGARQVRDSHAEAVLVFVMPPSLTVLEQRLRRRGDTSDVDARLAVARQQIAAAPDLFDFVVVNDELDAAISRVADILTSPAVRPTSVTEETP